MRWGAFYTKNVAEVGTDEHGLYIGPLRCPCCPQRCPHLCPSLLPWLCCAAMYTAIDIAKQKVPWSDVRIQETEQRLGSGHALRTLDLRQGTQKVAIEENLWQRLLKTAGGEQIGASSVARPALDMSR